MRFKGTFTLLIIAILFGGYIYFYEHKGGEKREAARKIENRIWQFNADDIVRVNLTTQHGSMIAEIGDDGQWRITSPKKWLGDNAQLNRLISSATRLDRESVVESNAADIAQFGLSPASHELRLTDKNGREYGIMFGENNPSGNSTYSSLTGGKEVFFVSAVAASFFDVEAEAFRNRNVLSFERARVESVTLRNPHGIIELEKDRDDRWWFRGPDKREAGGPAVREMLNALHLGTIPEFFDENAEDYVNASLNKHVIDVVLTFGQGRDLKRLVIGTEKSRLVKTSSKTAPENSADFEEMFLARDDSRNELFFVGKDLVDKLSRSANDIRDKSLVSFQRWDVDVIVIENTHGKFQLVKTDGDWFLDGPSKNRASWSEINNLLDVLEKPVVEWIDNPPSLTDYGVETPATRITLKKGSEIIAECAFGHAAANGVYARVSGDSSIKVADPDGLELLNRPESDYRDTN